MKQRVTNPAGREGKPFSLYPHTFDEVVDKMLNTPPPKVEAKRSSKGHKKAVKRKR